MCIESEAQLEQSLINDLVADGYGLVNVKNEKSLLLNLKEQLEKQNDVILSDENFSLILNYLGRGNSFEKANKLRDRFPITLEDGTAKHIEFLDSKRWCNNIFQVTNQVTIKGKKVNRYDVTILINGLPLVQIELKKRGVALHKGYIQIERYLDHSFNESYGLFGYVQMFVISNGARTKYYANNPQPSFKQTFYWADENNTPIWDIKQFSKVFLERCHLSKMICKYTVLTTQKIMMVMRPYQFYAVEKIIKQVEESNDNAYIWHTTGSGKTLTSFKAAGLLTDLEKIDKVVFVVDRKDLDTQTKIEFNKFKKDSVDGTDNTKRLVEQFNDDTSLVVTTIQKLNTAISKTKYLDEMESLRDENIVFIFDECHRSQFGQTHTKIVKFFKKAQMIGFTGTPILDENSIGKRTTKELFDECLHKYLIPDAFGDDNVLGFVVDYLTTKEVTTLENELRVLEKENKTKNKEEIQSLKVRIKEILESSERIEGITKHIIANHRTYTNNKFTAMMTVDSVDMLMAYYDSFKAKEHNLKIATIFSYSTTEESSDDIEDGNGASVDENNIDMVRKEKLEGYIADYNSMFDTNYSTDTKEYYNYYDDIADRVKNQEIDLLIVVNMFLTGFDAPRLNTLYVDKQLKHHGLIQAFSRTNRIYTGKEHGKIICFRDLQSKVEEAIKLFSDGDASSTLLRDNYETYLEKFNEQLVLLREIAKTPDEVKYLKTKQSKLEFVEVFRKLLTQLDTMKTFIEFEWDTLEITAQEINDYTSHYLDIYYDIKDGDTGEGENEDSESSDLSEVDFSLDLISRDVIDLLYILKLLFNLDDDDDKQRMSIYNIIRATPNLYRKKEIIEEFIKYFKASNGSIDNIDEEYTKFSNAKKENELNMFCEEYKLENKALTKLISKYLYDAKEIKSDDVVTLFTYKLKILERKRLVPKVQKLIMALIYKFEEM